MNDRTACRERNAGSSSRSSSPIGVLTSTSGLTSVSSTVGFDLRPSRQKCSTSKLSCSGSGPSTDVGGLSRRQNASEGAANTPRLSTSESGPASP